VTLIFRIVPSNATVVILAVSVGKQFWGASSTSKTGLIPFTEVGKVGGHENSDDGGSVVVATSVWLMTGVFKVQEERSIATIVNKTNSPAVGVIVPEGVLPEWDTRNWAGGGYSLDVGKLEASKLPDCPKGVASDYGLRTG